MIKGLSLIKDASGIAFPAGDELLAIFTKQILSGKVLRGLRLTVRWAGAKNPPHAFHPTLGEFW